jgi:hypothetical protein
MVGMSETHKTLGDWNRINIAGYLLLSNAIVYQHPAINEYTTVRKFLETLQTLHSCEAV